MGGTVTWGTFTPDSSAFATLQSQLQDSHDVEFTFSRQPAGSVSPPGLLSLGKIPVTITSGSPSITFPRYPNTPLDPNSFGTVFGTNCAGFAFGNTYVLGDPADPCGAISGVPGDWFDADGVLGPVNNSPTLSAPESASGEEGSTLATIVATATDPDATNTLTITQTGMPTDLEFSTTPGPSPCSATIVGTPGIDDAGEYTITWTVHDGVGGSANSTTVLTIQNGGQAPLVSAPVSASGSASAPIGFIITAGAPNGQQVTGMGAASLPQGATFVPGLTAGEARFDWAPEPDQLGSYEVTFTASNATGSDSVTTSITVISPDGPRRPWVAPALRRIGQGRGEHLLTRTGDGRTYVNAIVKGNISNEALEARGVDVTSRAGPHIVVRCLQDSLPALFDAPDVDAVLAPGLCQLLLDSSVVDIRVSGLRTLTPPPFKGKTGKGVVVGIVDTGVDFDHPDFRTTGSTRIVGYWDQTSEYPAKSPHTQSSLIGLDYGVEWTPSDILNPSPSYPWPQSNDLDGHGTHVAGIAAGNGRSQLGCFDGNVGYVGVAPEADLCVVKVPISRRNLALETAIEDGVNYVFQKARALHKPAVVNLSLGTNRGAHDGTSPLDFYLNYLTEPGIDIQRAPGDSARIIVAAAGNDAYSRRHASFDKVAGTRLEFEVPNYTQRPGAVDHVDLQGWFSASDSFEVWVVTPYDLRYGPVHCSRGGSGATWTTPNGEISVCSGSCTQSSLIPAELLISLGHSDQGVGTTPAPGPWALEITPLPPIFVSGRLDIYVMEQDLGPTTESVPTVTWTNADSSRTVLSPASADSVIAVGAHTTKKCWYYDLSNTNQQCDSANPSVIGDIAAYSSRGPRLDGVLKPDLTAPGAAIVACASQSATYDPRYLVHGNNEYVVQGGTSEAAPHVAGAAALLLAEPGLGGTWPSIVKGRLRGSARHDAFTGGFPNPRWGYGKLDIAATLAPVLSARVLKPSKGESDTTGRVVSLKAIMGTGSADSVVFHLSKTGCPEFASPIRRRARALRRGTVDAVVGTIRDVRVDAAPGVVVQRWRSAEWRLIQQRSSRISSRSHLPQVRHDFVRRHTVSLPSSGQRPAPFRPSQILSRSSGTP